MRDLRVVERLSVGMLAATCLPLLASIVTQALVYDYVSGIEVGYLGARGVDRSRAESLDSAVQMAAIAEVVLTFMTAAPFLVWLWRAASNAHERGLQGLRFTPRWAVRWWFVPFLNLVRPFQVVQELHAASTCVGAGRTHVASEAPSPLVTAWWMAMMVSALAGCCSGVTTSTSNVDAFKTATVMSVGYSAVRLLAALLAVAIVTRISRMQREWPPAATPAVAPTPHGG